GGDSECQLFQRAVNGGELITDNGTRQGIYVMTGAGRLLSRGNSLKADRVLGILERGLAAWDALPAEERTPRASGAQTAAEERWERSRPGDGLVLTRVVRDLPPAGGVDGERPRRWNRDALWFSKDEVRALVDAVQARPDGAPVPDVFTRRLVELALVDNVRGQCIPFEPNDVRRARLDVRRVEGEEGSLELTFEGTTLAVEDGEWALGESIWKPRKLHPHAMETRLLGRATYDVAADRFTAFELVALGRRSGFTELNSRRFDPEPRGIGFAITLDHRPWAAAPAFIALYEGDWVQRPRLGRELTKR
ncbi:MAG: hypothetical protein AAFZ87_05735, partial [Planctomycetota bacterium]